MTISPYSGKSYGSGKASKYSSKTPSKEYEAVSGVLKSSGATPEQATAIANLTKFAPQGSNKVDKTDSTIPTTSSPTTPVTDEEVTNLAKQGFTEGSNVPGKGILLPDGTFKAPTTAGTDETQIRQTQAKQPPVGVDMENTAEARVAADQTYKQLKGKSTTSPQVDLFYTEDKDVLTQSKELMDFLSPPSTQKMLIEGMKQIQGQQTQLLESKLELMDLEAIMDGTAEDIAKEVEAGNGFATSSQIAAMTVARNSTLLKKATYLQNKISIQQDLIANNTQLLQSEKEMANTQFSQRMAVFQYQQQNNDRMLNAFKDTISTIQKSLGWAGVLQAYGDNPRQLGYVESLYGGAGSVARLAEEEQRQQSLTSTDKDVENAVNLSSTSQAIIDNPNLFNSLTPTEKGRVITELSSAGYDTTPLGTKALSTAEIEKVAETQKALEDIKVLTSSIDSNLQYIGPITGLQALNPWSKGRQLQADINRVKQTIGKALEGGVLRKEDEEKYNKILPTMTDTEATARYKLSQLNSTLQADLARYTSLLQSGGRTTDVTAPLTKKGDVITGTSSSGNSYTITQE